VIGVELYRHLLAQALGQSGESQSAQKQADPEINLDLPALIPADYAVDAELRINLYARLACLRDLTAIEEFAEEIEDRLGEMPTTARTLLDIARLREMARRLDIVRVDAGPAAIAVTFAPERQTRPQPACAGALRWHGDRLIFEVTTTTADRVSATIEFLQSLSLS
jgi:transcription-repair coupling factor (superfamily II helicase)